VWRQMSVVSKALVKTEMDSGPVLNAVVKQTLDKLRAHYEVIAPNHAMHSGASMARGVLLEDGGGKVQIVVPADALIDLNILNQDLRRNLRAVPPDELAFFNQRLQMDEVSAMPLALGVQTVVDNELLSHEILYLNSGSNDLLVKTNVKLLNQLAEGAVTFGNFAVTSVARDTCTDTNEDKLSVTKAVKSFTSQRIKGRLEDTLELPPLPATAHRILQLLARPDANIEELVNIVEMDASLAMQVMCWAQSPYYSAPGKVNSIHEAIVRVLGYDLVMNLALGLSLSKTLRLPKEGVNGNLSFWEQSVYCAAIMEGLVRVTPARYRPPVGMAYLAGLLHNFGYLLLAEVFPPHFTTFCRYMEVNAHLNHYDVEQHLLQTNREQMGYWLMNLWGIPEEVGLAIRYQNHASYVGKGKVLANMLYVATRLLREFQPTDIAPETIPDEVLTKLHIDKSAIKQLGHAVFGQQEQLQNMARQLPH